MAQDIVNGNQNLSYTNLDFSSIYTEVLDMVKQLTKKWDPSISDESDPGVVLVKLSALLADKCNYNIDKSILEAFPLSVTQDSNARQLYEQLGYYMHWYKAATVPIAISWKTTTVTNKGEAIAYTIPKFTTITDDNETIVYSLVGTQGPDDIVVSDGILYTDSSKNLNMIAYEGIPVQYTFNGRTTITANMVDNQNRLYLSSAYVFENGIFIKNVTQDNYAEWHRVDNLYEYSYDEHRYKFGYDSATNLCYIEFPDNYAELFGSGIELVYLTFSTDESYSDVPTQFLSKFLSPPVVGDNGSVTLSQDVVSISNIEPATGHAEKEGINEAYTNYKKVVGTFKTLITLRDYLNYITSKELDICSNGFVTDRTNDVQSSYKIISKKNGVDSLLTEVEKDDLTVQFVKTEDVDIITGKTYYTRDGNNFTAVTNPDVSSISSYYEMIGEDMLSPFSLKFYLLQKAVAVTARGAYDNTFDMSRSDDLDMDALLNNTAHLVHNFEDILPIGEGIYKLTTDTDVPVENGIPTKIYYAFNKQTGRYEPTPVTSVTFQSYNPAAMKLYEDTSYEVDGVLVPEYTLTTDTEIITGKNYYSYNPTTNTYSVSPLPYTLNVADISPSGAFTVNISGVFLSKYVNEIRQSYITDNAVFEFDGTTWSINSDDITNSSLTINLADWGISINSSYETGATFTIVFDTTAAINPEALGLYELEEEPLLPHIVFFKNKYPITMSISTYNSVSKTVREEILKNIITAFYNNLDSSNIEFGDDISLDYLTEIAKSSDTRIKSVAFEALSYTTYAIYWDKNQNTFIEVALPNSVSQVGLSNISSLPTIENVTAYLFSKDIICKSILAGTTQLLIPDNNFAYHLNQEFISEISDIKYVTGEATINMAAQDKHYLLSQDIPEVMSSYTLQENETISMFRPSVTDIETYTSGVHYDYRIFSEIKAGQSRQLREDEWFIFYISNVDSDGILQSFSVYVYGEDAIIHPTFGVDARENLSEYGDEAVKIASADGAMTQRSVDTKVYSYSESRQYYVSQINNDTSINNTKITTNNSISAQKLDRFTVEESDGYRMIWHLNTPTYEGTTKQYMLFPAYDPTNEQNSDNSETINSYTLKSGEYLYYTDQYMSSLGILGAGTTITRNCGTTNFEIVDVVSKPYVFVNWTAVQNFGEFEKLGTTDTQGTFKLNPAANGLFVYNNGAFIRTDDTEEQQQTYYILLMKDVAGWYIKQSSDSYTPAVAPTTTVFEVVPPTDLVGKNPSNEGWFEVVTSNSKQIADTYLMPVKSCNSSDDYINNRELRGDTNKVLRYTLTTDTAVVSNKTYYKVNVYANKIFRKVDPLVCPAIDTLDLTTNPLQVMRKLFQKVQTNTSLTFTRNEIWTISQGDTIYVQAPRISVSESFDVVFPTFTNKDIILDLDKYSVSYKRIGDDIVSLDKITVKDCYWKAYSNLQLNTNTDNGQALLPNHSLTVYGTDMSLPLTAPFLGSLNTNVHFQLKYPVSNRTGSFIQVDTSSMTEEEILNTIYVYNVSPDKDNYSFSSDNYTTYVYMKKANLPITQTVTLENIKLPEGNYLIPINGRDDMKISLVYTPGATTSVPEPTPQPLYSFIDETKDYALGDKLHFMRLIVAAEDSGSSSGTLAVTVSDINSSNPPTMDIALPLTIQINDIFKCDQNPIFENCYQEIKDKVLALDVNQKYDYTHIPDDDDIIPDPLVPRAFWNKNHVYNKFTIAQLNADNIDYKFIT